MVFASARSSSTRSTRTERSRSLMVGAAAFTGATAPILRQAFVDPDAQGAAERQRPLAWVTLRDARVVGASDQDEQARMRPDRRADPEETERALTRASARIRRGCGADKHRGAQQERPERQRGDRGRGPNIIRHKPDFGPEREILHDRAVIRRAGTTGRSPEPYDDLVMTPPLRRGIVLRRVY